MSWYCKEVIGTTVGCHDSYPPPTFYERSSLGNITSENFVKLVKGLMESGEITRIEIVQSQNTPDESGWRLDYESRPGVCANKIGHSLMMEMRESR